MVPPWLPERWRDKWRKPWNVKSGRLYDVRFKRRLRRHGYLSPNFRVSEFASKSDNCGCPATAVPKRLRRRTQTLCFKLEKVRHAVGDVSIGVLSGYRSGCHNQCVGGASASQHPKGRAIDVIKPASVDQGRFDTALRHVFQHGGIGSGCSSGKVMHVDTGPERRWCYPGS